MVVGSPTVCRAAAGAGLAACAPRPWTDRAFGSALCHCAGKRGDQLRKQTEANVAQRCGVGQVGDRSTRRSSARGECHDQRAPPEGTSFRRHRSSRTGPADLRERFEVTSPRRCQARDIDRCLRNTDLRSRSSPRWHWSCQADPALRDASVLDACHGAGAFVG